MRYVSTRGEAPVLGFEDVLLTGLARDGGLYVPETWPRLSPADFESFSARPYAEVAHRVMAPFVGDAIPPAALERMIADAYASFDHPAVVPLVQIDSNHWLLELFHGPTLAFKDVAMQLLARLIDWALAKRGTHAIIVAATSGDTGASAVEAFKDSTQASLFVMHPHGRVSEVQRRQMTAVDSPSIHNIAIEGNFDDCQAILKGLFNDQAFRDRVALAGVNSINWARIMAQIVYYVTAGVSLGAPSRKVSFSVPTGNFGDIFAGYAAKRMGLAVDRLLIATNENDILDRALKTGRYEVRKVLPSTSPSMDIQVSSNFERLLFELNGRDAGGVRRLMASLQQSGGFTLDEETLAAIRGEFRSGSKNSEACAELIARTSRASGVILDPHTAAGYGVARDEAGSSPMITLATAHPAKFPDAVGAACGVRPGLPPRLSHLMMAKEYMTILPNDAEAVKSFILGKIGSAR
ncbi:threonine synthase [soil metagenome]